MLESQLAYGFRTCRVSFRTFRAGAWGAGFTFGGLFRAFRDVSYVQVESGLGFISSGQVSYLQGRVCSFRMAFARSGQVSSVQGRFRISRASFVSYVQGGLFILSGELRTFS